MTTEKKFPQKGASKHSPFHALNWKIALPFAGLVYLKTRVFLFTCQRAGAANISSSQQVLACPHKIPAECIEYHGFKAVG
jgi:hypothetical protein